MEIKENNQTPDVIQTKDVARSFGYINVICDGTMYARIPFQPQGYEEPGDLNEEQAHEIADLISSVIQTRRVTYNIGDRFKFIHDKANRTLVVDIVAANGVIARDERFYSFNSIKKINS